VILLPSEPRIGTHYSQLNENGTELSPRSDSAKNHEIAIDDDAIRAIFIQKHEGRCGSNVAVSLDMHRDALRGQADGFIKTFPFT